MQNYGNDAFRLDAIKQVDPSWLASLRPAITSYSPVADGGTPQQHFYMVGETYDFEDTGAHRELHQPDDTGSTASSTSRSATASSTPCSRATRAAARILNHAPTPDDKLLVELQRAARACTGLAAVHGLNDAFYADRPAPS